MLNMASFKDNYSFYLKIFFFEIFFHLCIVMIFANVFLGLIADAFGELREVAWAKENDKNNICFICQIDSDTCGIKGIDYEEHVKETHNLWYYVYFLCYLYMKDENEYNIGVDALRKRFDSFSQKQKKEAEAFRAEHSARRRLMEQQERDELKGLGADTKAIDECRGEIGRLQAVLDKIARNHDNVVEFRKDEKELLSHEGEYRESKQRYEAIDVQASKDCDEKCGRLAMMRSEEQAALDKGNARCSEMK